MSALVQDAPAVILVNELLTCAFRERASDIHLEPQLKGMLVRLRIDGALHASRTIEASIMHAVCARLKVLSYMNTAEHRIPQDGKFFVTIDNHMLDIRVATFPTLYGEKIVLRLLDRSRQLRGLHELGCDSEVFNKLVAMMQKEWGFILVTGPTGAGKTTTLYALLNMLDRHNIHIATLEEPIEYAIDGVIQGPIHSEIGFTFEVGLRALLRQDPDVLLLGEIRDRETARVALQAALTGHRVISTIHTHDAPSAIIRLIDMGIEPFLIASAVAGILSQRLVRMLCISCRVEEKLTDEMQKYCEERYHTKLKRIFSARGCTACSQRGYYGRTGVFELLAITPDIRAHIHKRTSLQDITERASLEGYQPLMCDALRKVEEGVIGFSELLRIA
jgi:type II secretory ATPase GspE/PulE/Tfp pilus assembly ATPase PilB-like protein